MGLQANRLARLAALVLLLPVALAATAVEAGTRYAALVMDANSGKILHEQNADGLRFPASLTKMMTLYIVFDMLTTGRVTLDTQLKVSARAAAAQPSKLGLKAGETIAVRDAIKALVTKSANDVAVTVAENLAGSEEKFARYMTAKAKKIGMKSTLFKNASGLPHPAQQTTARDLLTLALHLNDDFPKYYSYFKTPYFKFRGSRHRNHNGLLFSFEGTDGIKTGYTRASGFNLVASVRKNGKHVIGVVLGGNTSRDRNSRMRSLMRNALAISSKTQSRRKSAPEPALVASNEAAAKPAFTVVKKKRVQLATAAIAGDSKPKKPIKSMESLISHYVGLTRSANGGPLSPAEAAILTVPASEAAWSTDESPVVVAASASEPPEDPTSDGPFQVQVGAYPTQSEAIARLGRVREKVGDALAGHAPVAIEYSAPNKMWYRARFAGFDEGKARATCQAMKTQDIDCLVMRAQ